MFEKEIIYSPDTRDFALYLNKELIGFSRTYQEGEVTLDDLVYVLLSNPRYSKQFKKKEAV